MWSLPGADRSRERVDRASRSWSHGRRRALSGHKKSVDSLSWNCSGTRLASSSRDFTVRDPEGNLWAFGTYRPA